MVNFENLNKDNKIASNLVEQPKKTATTKKDSRKNR